MVESIDYNVCCVTLSDYIKLQIYLLRLLIQFLDAPFNRLTSVLPLLLHAALSLNLKSTHVQFTFMCGAGVPHFSGTFTCQQDLLCRLYRSVRPCAAVPRLPRCESIWWYINTNLYWSCCYLQVNKCCLYLYSCTVATFRRARVRW